MAKSINCKCEYNFTCSYCCQNAPPWINTPDTGFYFSKCIEAANKKAEADKKSEERLK